MKNALQNSVLARSTGRVFFFSVETEKVDASEMKVVLVRIVALNMAQAWRIIGEAVERFMDGPSGRLVNSIILLVRS